jgi:hypothetical protein
MESGSGLVSLGARAALSVVGRSANTPGTAADIVAANTGDVLYMGASSLVWGQLGTASYQDASVTAAKLGADVVLNALQDVSVTGAASAGLPAVQRHGVGQREPRRAGVGERHARVRAGRRQRSHRCVGRRHRQGRKPPAGLGRCAASTSCSLGSSAPAPTSARASASNATGGPIGFYDQATTTFASGTEVMEWGTSATAGSRYFRYQDPAACVRRRQQEPRL